MSDKQFVDTNVLVYAYDVSAGAKHERARALLEEFWESGAGCLSIQVLQEFYVNVTRKVAHPLDSDTALQVVTDLGEGLYIPRPLTTWWRPSSCTAGTHSRFGTR